MRRKWGRYPAVLQIRLGAADKAALQELARAVGRTPGVLGREAVEALLQGRIAPPKTAAGTAGDGAIAAGHGVAWTGVIALREDGSTAVPEGHLCRFGPGDTLVLDADGIRIGDGA